MAARDTAQLILEVDARIATAQRALSQLARSVQQDAQKSGESLKQVEQASQRVAKSLGSISNRTRAGFTQLSFQIGDVSQQMALGVDASRIFAQQSGQVIQALQIMGGEGNKFLRFLGGPWGIAISTAAVVLGPLAAKLFENKDAVGALVEKMREQAKQAALNKQADEAWKDTIEGLTDAIRKRREEQEKARRSDVTAEFESFREAESELTTLAGKIEAKAAELQTAVAKVRSLRRELEDPSIAGTPQQTQIEGALARAEDTVRRLRGEVQNGLEGLRKGREALLGEQAKILTRQAEQAVDPMKKTSDQIAFEIDRLTDNFINGQIGPAAYRKEIERLTKALKDAKDSARGAGKVLTDFALPVQGQIRGKFGEQRPGHNHAGVDIAVPVGTAVKAPAGGVVIEAGTLPEYGNVVFIDHGGGTITRLAHLSKIGVAKGQQLSAGDVIGLSGGARGAPGSGNSQGPHVHYEVRVGGKAVDPLKGKFATDAAAATLKGGRLTETAEQKALRQQNAFEEELDRLNKELLRAKAELVHGVDAEADFAIEQLQLEQQARKAAIDNDAAEGKISQANAEILKAKVDQIAFEKMRAVEVQRAIERLRRQDEAEQRRFQYRIDDLRFADEMARTQAEHRKLQLDILDVVYRQKEAHLRALKAELELAGKIEEAAAVQAQIDRLPTDKAQDTTRVLRGTMSPLEAWADQVPKTAAEINEALQSIEARGLDSLANAITDVISGTKSLGDAFEDVARQIINDIIQMTVRMLIFRAISGMLGGGGAPGGGWTGPDFIGGPMSAKGNVFNRGAIVPHRLGGVVNQLSFFPMAGGKVGSMAEDGPEAIMPLGRDSMGRMGVRAVGAARRAREPIELIIHSAPSDDAWAKVDLISTHRAGEAVKISVDHTSQTLRRLARPKLNN